ncbi:hypothetical protein [Streptomyces sp. NPDC046887]|uniref:hypothetical protein n=1 Tax=Streptomyces sp. NPDC046887 TaxID=3155472 RepID=UPI0033D40B18
MPDTNHRAPHRSRLHRTVTGCLLAAALAGCSGEPPQRPAASPSPAPSASRTPSTAPGGEPAAARFTADPERIPRSPAQAEELTDRVALQPPDWGADFTAERKARSAPRTVAVLDVDCRWQRRSLPPGVLASLSTYARRPGTDGKGPLRVTSVVTVHTTEVGADQELNDTLEQSMRCPEQQISTDERTGELQSAATPFGTRGQIWADDQVVEQGTYVTSDGALPYSWTIARIGTVTLAVSTRAGRGYTPQELMELAGEPLAVMGERVKARTGREG